MPGYLDVGPLQTSGSGGLDVAPLQGGAQNLIQATTVLPTRVAFGSGSVTFESQTIASTTVLPSRVAFGSGSVMHPPQTIAATTVIPTRVAFGSGSLSVSINSLYIIPSRVAFGHGAVLQRSYISIFVNGVDVSTLVLVNSVQISNSLSQPSTLNFALWDKTGTVVPAVGQTVIVYLGSLRIFAGQVQQPFQTGYQAFAGFLYSGSGTTSGSTGGVGSATGSTATGGVQCTDWTNLLNRRYVGLYFDGDDHPVESNLSSIVRYIVNTYFAQDGFTYDDSDGDPGIDLGPTLFNWVTGTAAFNTLSSSTGWEWSCDYFQVIRFYPSTSGLGTAAFDLTNNDGNVYAESLGVEYFQQQYRNMQGVLSPTASSALWSDTFSASQPGPFPLEPQPPDGIRQAFFELYAMTAIPQVLVNGVQQTVINLETTALGNNEWYILLGGLGQQIAYGVFQNPSSTPLQPLDVLVISYAVPLSPIYWVSNPAQIAERAAIEGNSGVYQDVEQAPSVTDPNAIAAYAAGLLARYGDGIPFQVTYSSRNQKGLFAGQIQRIVLSNPPLNFTGLITSVGWQDVDGQFMQLGVTVASGMYQGNFNFAQFMAALIAQATLPQPSAFAAYQLLIAPNYPGYTNPGITGGNYVQSMVIQHSVEIFYSFSVTLPNAVTGSEMNFVLENASQGLAVMGTVSFQVGESGTQTIYGTFAAPFLCYKGDLIQIEVGGTGGAIMGGIANLVTSVAVV